MNLNGARIVDKAFKVIILDLKPQNQMCDITIKAMFFNQNVIKSS